MKPRNSKRGGSAAKRKGPPKTIDEYLAGVPTAHRAMLGRIRTAIRSAAPPETIEAISYGMPAFKYKGTLMWFASFSDHCSIFPTAAVMDEFKTKLKRFTVSKGTIHFTTKEPIPLTLVKKLVKARVAQVEAKAASR